MRKDHYVLAEARKGSQGHTCHHPTCDRKVPPSMFCCRDHWYALPMDIRLEIWRTFRPGQEQTKTPSAEYLAAAKRALEFWKEEAMTRQYIGCQFKRGQGRIYTYHYDGEDRIAVGDEVEVGDRKGEGVQTVFVATVGNPKPQFPTKPINGKAKPKEETGSAG